MLLKNYGASLKKNWREVAPFGLWLLLTAVLTLALRLMHSPLAPLPGVVTLLVVPGALLMVLLKTRPSQTAGRLVLAVTLSMMVIMVVGAAASLIGPSIGVARPLDTVPEIVIWVLLAFLGLVICASRPCNPVSWVFDDVRSTHICGALASLVLVTFSILGVARLNHTGSIGLAILATILDVIVLLAGVAGGWSRASRWPLSTLLYGVSLALLLLTSLRGGHLYGWDVQQEFGVASHTLSAGVWVVPANHDPYGSMLSLTVLPTVLRSLLGLRLLAFFQLVVPGILALLPVAVFSTVRSVPRWVTSGRSVPRSGLAFAVVVGLIISSVAFSSELVSITRQAMALTMLTALVMVLYDRSIMKRPAQIVVGLLLVAISFTHYTTSYLLAGIFLCSWLVSLMWSQGWLGTPKKRVAQHRYDMRSRRVISLSLVVVAFVAAFGWNSAITRNSALSAPSSAITTKGVGIESSTLSTVIPPRVFERLLISELRKTASYIVPEPDASTVHLVSAKAPSAPGVLPSLAGVWNELNYLVVESLWVVLGLALLYGLFRLARRRSYEYSADLVGLAVTGLLIGGFLRFSGTLASYYSPERAAIFTAILLAAPTTLFIDDLVTRLRNVRRGSRSRVQRVSLSAGLIYLAVLIIGATGLSSLFFGGPSPGSLSADGVNAQQFTVSTPEVATAVWLRNHAGPQSIVQSDLYGHLVLLSEPGRYDLIDEIVPPEVDQGAYVYLSTVNLVDRVSQADADGGDYVSVYRSNVKFFNQNYFVAYSNGFTRVYH